MTWYPQDFIKVPMTDMRMRSDPSSGYPGRTYRFYRGEKIFEYGYGLSYSTYSYKFTSVTQNKLYLNQSSTSQLVKNSNSLHFMSVSDMSAELCEKMKFSATVGVKNGGELAGKHSVLLFVRSNVETNGRPMKQLVGFDKVSLNAGQRAEIEFLLNPCEHLGRANKDGVMVIEEGLNFLVVGNEEYPITITI